jgi:hypothetical protein
VEGIPSLQGLQKFTCAHVPLLAPLPALAEDPPSKPQGYQKSQEKLEVVTVKSDSLPLEIHRKLGEKARTNSLGY